MNPATPKTELPPSTRLRKAVFGGAHKPLVAMKRWFPLITASFVTLALAPAAEPARKTTVAIIGEEFHLNGKPTYEGRTWNGKKIQGLLMNSRMVQGIFDDLNPDTVARWDYPDTKKWDAERNTREFLAAMPEWRRHGLLAVTLNFQGGNPQGYVEGQPWHNSAITPEGELRPDYMARLERILNRADELGMVAILGIFYFGQDQRLKDEAAVLRGLDNAIDWVLDRDYRNVLIEVNNECDVRYDHAILKPNRVHELIERVKARQRHGRRLLVSTSYGGKSLPRENVVRSADFLLLHGNSISNPDGIAALVRQTRHVPGYRPMPILFNEDDHFDFDQPRNNLLAALGEYASWGYFDYRMRGEGFDDGYQSVPVNWSLSSDRKRAFFAKLAEITGCAADAMAFPGKDWEEATPSSQGVDPEKLRAAIEYLEKQSGAEGVKRLVIVRHGRMIFRGPEADRQQPVASVTKAFTSTAHGLLIEDGKCTLDTLAKDFNPALAQHYSTVTLRHFATMTSGFDGVGGTDDCDAEKKRCDANALVDPLPPVFAPGTKYMYWDEATQQYGYTLTQIAGESLDDYLRRRIVDPIGMTRFAWRPDATGKVLNWTGGIEGSASDLARFGHLFLNRGNWNGKQLISAAWVRDATAVQVPASLPSGRPSSDRQGSGIYGYHWWPNGIKPDGQRHWPDAPLGTFARSGFKNNILFVIPEWDTVIVRLSPDRQERKIRADEYNLFLKKLGEAILRPVESGNKGTGRTGAFEAKPLPDRSGRLSLSPNRRYLVDQHGQPFFYLADTGWELFHRLTREEAEQYLDNRAAKGFTVIMVMGLTENGGLDIPTRYGHLPLTDNDPTRPNEAYFKHVDDIIDRAADRGLCVALLPTWGDKVRKAWGKGPEIFNVTNARVYGEFLGKRYKDKPVIWILGGDRSPVGYEAIWRSLAQGLAAGDQGAHLMSYHGADGQERRGSSPFFHSEAWLGFNLTYSGHAWSAPSYKQIARDRALIPAKPTLDGEPVYENHPYHADGTPFFQKRNAWDGTTRGDAHQVRQAAYWAMLAGATGHTYGCHDVWQFFEQGRTPITHGNTDWRKAMDFDGAGQMGIMRRLFEARPWYRMAPDQSVIAAGQGRAEDHIQAARADDGSFLLAYLPLGHPVTINMDKVSGSTVKAHWFNPREGTWTFIGEYPSTATREFIPPSSGLTSDWVLVLDDAAKESPVTDVKR